MSDSSGTSPPGLVSASPSSSGADSGLQGGQPSPVDSSSSEEDGGRKGSKDPDGKGGRISDGKSPPRMQLGDWWVLPGHYNLLPNRLYFFLGAKITGSRGENEWYSLIALLRLVPPHGRRSAALKAAPAMVRAQPGQGVTFR